MHNNNHTQGPWKTGDSDYKIIIGPHTRFRGKSLAGIALIDETDDNGEDLANAQLIAAAPCMLLALTIARAHIRRALEEIPENDGHLAGALAVIEETIAKATSPRA